MLVPNVSTHLFQEKNSGPSSSRHSKADLVSAAVLDRVPLAKEFCSRKRDLHSKYISDKWSL